MLDLDPTQNRKRGAAFFALDEDLDEAWILEHQLSLVEQSQSLIKKKFEKENEKLVADGARPLPNSDLKARLMVAAELAAKFKKENKTKKVECEGRAPSVEKLDAAIAKMSQKIHEAELDMQSRDNNKEVALGTSKIVSFCFIGGDFFCCYPSFGLCCPASITAVGGTMADRSDRTTLTRVSPSCLSKSSTSRLSASFPRRCVKSSTGQSSRSRTRTGSFETCCGSSPCFSLFLAT